VDSDHELFYYSIGLLAFISVILWTLPGFDSFIILASVDCVEKYLGPELYKIFWKQILELAATNVELLYPVYLQAQPLCVVSSDG
jgi:hypothetical protein